MLKHTLAAALVFLPNILLAGGDPKICYREDAAPFSYVEGGQPLGYSVDLCRFALEKAGWPDPGMVLVTAENRFEMLTEGTCNVLCEATTVTMKRREDVEFSLITFLTGSAFLFPKAISEMDPKTEELTVGFLSGTTAHEKWREGDLIGGTAFNISFEPVEQHDEAIENLKNGDLNAYVADREILERIINEHKVLADAFMVGKRSLSYEPYALAVEMGNDELRIKIDDALADLFRERDNTRMINDILGKYIPQRRFDPIMVELFELQSLPE